MLTLPIVAEAQMDALMWGGQPFPGGGVQTQQTSHVNINKAGQISYMTGLVATTNGTSDNVAVGLIDGGTVIELARKGDALPHGDGKFLFESFSYTNQMTIDELGGVYHYTPVTATTTNSEAGLFRYHEDGNLTIALQGVSIAELDDFYPIISGRSWSFFPILYSEDSIILLANLGHAEQENKIALLEWDVHTGFQILLNDGFPVGTEHTGYFKLQASTKVSPITVGYDGNILLWISLVNNETETETNAFVTLDSQYNAHLQVLLGAPSVDGLRTVNSVTATYASHASDPVIETLEVDFANKTSLAYYVFNGDGEIQFVTSNADQINTWNVGFVGSILSKGDGTGYAQLVVRQGNNFTTSIDVVYAFGSDSWEPLIWETQSIPNFPDSKIREITSIVPINRDDFLVNVSVSIENQQQLAMLAYIDGNFQLVYVSKDEFQGKEIFVAVPDAEGWDWTSPIRIPSRMGNDSGQVAMQVLTGTSINNVDNIYVSRWTPSDEPPATFWAGYPVETAEGSQWVNTGDFLGWINIDHAPFVWITNLNREAYVYENYIQNNSGYVFFPTRNGQSMSWNNPSVVDGTEWVNSEDFLGWVDITAKPWHFHPGGLGWFYMPEAWNTPGSGAWAFVF